MHFAYIGDLIKVGDKIMEVKDEAIERMKLLQLHPNVIKEFQDENKLNRSEISLGFLYWLKDEEQQLVNDFEKEHEGYLVYHLIKTNTIDMGIIYDLLFVSIFEDEWFLEREELKDNIALSYSVTPFLEIGSICIKQKNGGLVRTF